MNVIKISNNVIQRPDSFLIKGIVSIESDRFNYQDMLSIVKLIEDAADKIIDDYILANKPKD